MSIFADPDPVSDDEPEVSIEDVLAVVEEQSRLFNQIEGEFEAVREQNLRAAFEANYDPADLEQWKREAMASGAFAQECMATSENHCTDSIKYRWGVAPVVRPQSVIRFTT